MNHQNGPRRRAAWTVVSIVVVIVVTIVGVWFLIVNPIQKQDTGVVPITITAPTPTVTSTQVTPTAAPTPTPMRECQAGWPVSFTWPDLGIDGATIEKIGSTDGIPDAPEGKQNVGVYQETVNGRTWGNLPGQGLGNVIFDGHTWRDGTAVFKADADEHIKEGSVFWFTMDNGSVCKYQTTVVWHQLAKDASDASPEHPTFASVLEEQGFYDLEYPSERLVGMTCSGGFNPAGTHHLYETAWYATPIN